MFNKISVLKVVDRWLGTVLVQLLPKPLNRQQKILNPCAILLIRPGGIGDAVLLVPAIHALQARFPQVDIDILAERRNAGVFALCPGIHNVFCYDRPWHMLAVLRKRYDVVIDTEQWYRLSAVIARLVRAPLKIGYATNVRRRMFTLPISYRQDDYEVVSFLRLLQPFGLVDALMPGGAWLEIPETARRSAGQWLQDGDDRPLVVLFPGASIPEKQWEEDRFRELADCCRKQGTRVVLVGGGGDRSACERIAVSGDVINLAGSTSLAETAAILARAAVVVSGDSGVLHMAVGLGRPTVALFGPSSADKWAPKGEGHVVLRPTVCPSCSRFGNTPACPHGVRCLNEITVDEVISAIDSLLNRVSAETSLSVQELRDDCR